MSRVGRGLGDGLAEPNAQLRAYRRAVVVPGSAAGLTRQELAERVNHWLYAHTGKVYEIDANYIGKLERGVIRWPQRTYREALRAVLGVGSDQELGFFIRRSADSTVEDMDRHQFLRIAAATGAGALAGSALGLPASAAPTPVPTRIGRTEIAQLRLAAETFNQWAHRFGGVAAREVATAQLNWAARLLRADCPAALRPELLSAVALLGEVTGFATFDACAHDDARKIFRFALACAEEADDWHQRANLLSSMARQSAWCGQPDAALTQVELALVRSDRLTATIRANLHTIRARALAKMGRIQQTLAAVGNADEEFAHTRPQNDPQWVRFYDHAQHRGDTAHALFDIALRGRRRTEAGPRLAYATAHYGAAYPRSRVFTEIKLASLTMATGDPRRAAVIGHRALADGQSLRSRRAVEELRELHRFCERQHRIPEVTELRDRISEVVTASA